MTKFFVTRTFSDGVTLTKWVSSLKVQFRHKKSLVTKNWTFSDKFFRHWKYILLLCMINCSICPGWAWSHLYKFATTSKKLQCDKISNSNASLLFFQTSSAWSQVHNKWQTVSSSCPQSSHVPFGIILRWAKLDFVARISRPAFQMKCFIFYGIFICHMVFQIFLLVDSSEQFASVLCSFSSSANT